MLELILPPRQNATVYLKDYRPPDFLVETVDLCFELGEESTLVTSLLRVRRNGEHDRELVLHGEMLELDSITIDGEAPGAEDYRISEHDLVVRDVPVDFEIEIITRIRPQENTALSGLYKSSGNFCTQCEAEGFRRITYYPDRPDVMARFTTTIIADRSKYPVMLSNGNLAGEEDLGDGRHSARWVDPFPKPSYLFALVAGDLARIEDKFVTTSGRDVSLYIYTQHHNIDRCEHAMLSLKKSMRWDEDVYGREYDLDVFNIVAVDDFNMGAMENKSLNVFNSKYVLARPDTATDVDYVGIEGVIGHEYFHNWSGNRVTCRDWFQLSLKEGFTVFRDQEFSADMGSRGVKRIQEIRILRAYQFQEDGGPMAHPVRPDSYQEINNFYTVTVYNKGAEVVRMLSRLLGTGRFRRGTDLYFDRHDGQAVTTEDFITALEDANGEDFGQFRRWYDQAGTPELDVETTYDVQAKVLRLSLTQTCPSTPGQPEKQPFHIPVAIALYAEDGREMRSEEVFSITEASQVLEIPGVAERPIVSILRDFSAPVKLNFDQSVEDLYRLMISDTDPFARWEAGQKRMVSILVDLAGAVIEGGDLQLDEEFVEAMRAVVGSPDPDLAFLAEMLILPAETYLGEFVTPIDPIAIHRAKKYMQSTLAAGLERDLLERYRACRDNGPYEISSGAIGRRAIKNICLDYLVRLNTDQYFQLAAEQYHDADNMTDTISALSSLVNSSCPTREENLGSFYDRWKGDPLVVDKWLTLQACSDHAGTLQRVKELCEHEAFDMQNPNKVRALIGAFAQANPVGFHLLSGDGYHFVADRIIELDPINPQIAARLMGNFNRWRQFEPIRSALMREQVERILSAPGLSPDVSEIAEKALKG